MVEQYLRRSCFNKLSVEQLVQACEELGFEGHLELVALIRKRTSTIMTSSIVEHLNNWQKKTAVLPVIADIVDLRPVCVRASEVRW